MSANVDARGLSCPQPVILTREALQEPGAAAVTVLLDSMTQVYNCSRAAEKLGWQAVYEEKDGVFELTLQRQPAGSKR